MLQDNRPNPAIYLHVLKSRNDLFDVNHMTHMLQALTAIRPSPVVERILRSKASSGVMTMDGCNTYISAKMIDNTVVTMIPNRVRIKNLNIFTLKRYSNPLEI